MIRIHDLHKKYKEFELNVSMTIPEGVVTGLIGKNGAGKSTTIKAILGLIRPDSGEITVLGKAPGTDMAGIGAAFSDSGFSILHTIEDVIRINKKFYPDFDEKKFRRRCGRTGLPMNKKIKEFSTGMKARLRVINALSHNAKLLVLDEPTSGLDVLARNDVLDMLRDYMEEDDTRSILISSHISSDLEGICDDIYMIDDGEIVLHEDTDTLLGSYGILKMTGEQFEALDREHVIAECRDNMCVTCLTREKQYYLDNYPDVVVENCSIDDVIVMLLGGNER